MVFIDKQLLKFLIAGVANTIAGSAVMFLLYNFFGQSYWVSSACNYIVGGMLSFFLNKYFTFQNTQKSFKQVILFISTLFICYLAAYILAKKIIYMVLSPYPLHIKDNAAFICGMCLYTALNYFAQRFIVFKKERIE